MTPNRRSNSKWVHGPIRRQKAEQELVPLLKPKNQASNSLNLQRALTTPGSTSPETVLQLQRLAGNRAVEQLLQGQTVQPKLTTTPLLAKYGPGTDRPNRLAKMNSGRVQRLFGKKKKKLPDLTNKTYQETGEVPMGQNVYFTLKVALKTGTKTRGKASLSEIMAGGGGHSWIEISLGPDYPSLEEMIANAPQGQEVVQAIGEITRGQLTGSGATTIGFYPDVADATNLDMMAKQLFVDLPGKLLEPEQDHFAGQQRGEKSFAITSPEAAIRLFTLIEEYRNHPYNILRHNCTDFAIKAAKAAGLTLSGVTNKMGSTSPTRLYKKFYKMAELGDQSAKYTDVTLGSNRQGKMYDIKHISSGAQKRLEKKKRKLGFSTVPVPRKTQDIINWKRPGVEGEENQPAQDEPQNNAPQIIAQHVIPENRLLYLVSGGMLRGGTPIGLTGVVKDGNCEVIVGEGTVFQVEANHFQAVMGFYYPGTEPAQEENEPDQLENRDEVRQDQPGNLDQTPPEPEPPQLDYDPQAWAGQEFTLSNGLTINRSNGETITLNPGHGVYVTGVANGFVTIDTGSLGRGFRIPVAEFKDAL